MFNSRLALYARTFASADLRDAVDELRRCVLAHQGPVSRDELLQAYRSELPSTAMRDVEECYKRTYGGARREGGIAGAVAPTPLPRLVTSLPAVGRRYDNVAVGESAKGVDAHFSPASAVSGKRVNHWEDLTPVTRGEWLCLMVGEGWKDGRTAPVTRMTC